MSADSICKIIKYVRDNAHKYPEKWPFSRGEGGGFDPSTSYENISGHWVFTDFSKRPQVDIGGGLLKNLLIEGEGGGGSEFDPTRSYNISGTWSFSNIPSWRIKKPGTQTEEYIFYPFLTTNSTPTIESEWTFTAIPKFVNQSGSHKFLTALDYGNYLKTNITDAKDAQKDVSIKVVGGNAEYNSFIERFRYIDTSSSSAIMHELSIGISTNSEPRIFYDTVLSNSEKSFNPYFEFFCLANNPLNGVGIVPLKAEVSTEKSSSDRIRKGIQLSLENQTESFISLMSYTNKQSWHNGMFAMRSKGPLSANNSIFRIDEYYRYNDLNEIEMTEICFSKFYDEPDINKPWFTWKLNANPESDPTTMMSFQSFNYPERFVAVQSPSNCPEYQPVAINECPNIILPIAERVVYRTYKIKKDANTDIIKQSLLLQWDDGYESVITERSYEYNTVSKETIGITDGLKEIVDKEEIPRFLNSPLGRARIRERNK